MSNEFVALRTFAGVSNRVKLRQLKEKMISLADLIGRTINIETDDVDFVNELILVSVKTTCLLGAINDILERGRVGDKSMNVISADFNDEHLDDFLKSASIYAAIIESSLVHQRTERLSI